MIRITRETDYGIMLMTTMALDASQSYSAAALARRSHVSLPMVSKILKTLARAGLLVSQRGSRGGYSLARSAEEISAADIIDALEGPIAITECSADGAHLCSHQDYCGVGGHWNRINRAIREALKNINLLEMSQPAPVAVALPTSGRIPPSLSADQL